MRRLSHLYVAGASDPVLAEQIGGTYYPCGSSQGRLAYQRGAKSTGSDSAAFIYFLGEDSCSEAIGWRIGGEFGSVEAWTYHCEEGTSRVIEDMPPVVGWRTSRDGPIDAMLTVSTSQADVPALVEDESSGPPSFHAPSQIKVRDPWPPYRCLQYHGVVYLPYMMTPLLDELRCSFVLQGRDVVVVSHPRCGTTWCQTIVLNMLHGGSPGKIHDPMKEAPWIEASVCQGRQSLTDLNCRDGGTGTSGMRCLKTHAPAHLAPWQRADRGAKLLLMTRDPRDVAVSHYFHILNSAYKFQGTWNEFCDLFLSGLVEGGDFWEWHEGWSNRIGASLPGQVEECLWVRYEDLILDLRGQIERIATFLGLTGNSVDGDDVRPLGSLVLGKAELDAVAAATDFTSMRELFLRRNAIKEACCKKFDPDHLRKGVAGGWPELMSQAQSDAFSARTAKCSATEWARTHVT